MKSFFQRWQVILFPLIDIFIHGGNYLFHLLVSRQLSSNEYGIFSAQISFLALFLVFGASIQIFVASTIAKRPTVSISTFRKFYFQSTLLSLAILLTLFLSQSILLKILQASTIHLVLLFLILLFNLYVSILRGYFQGTQYFYLISFSLGIEVSIKILLVTFFITNFPSVIFVLISIFVGMFVSFLLSFIITEKKLRNLISSNESNVVSDTRTNESDNTRTNPISLVHSVPFLLVNFFIYGFMAFEMIAVLNFLPNQAGDFAVMSRISQLLFFATTSVFTLYLPKLSESIGNSNLFQKLFKQLIIIIVFMQSFAVLFFLLFGGRLIPLLFGTHYEKAATYLPLGLILYSLFSLLYIQFMTSVLTKKYIVFLIALLGLIVQFVLFQNYHGTIQYLIYIQIGIYSCMNLVFYLFNKAFIYKKGNKHA